MATLPISDPGLVASAPDVRSGPPRTRAEHIARLNAFAAAKMQKFDRNRNAGLELDEFIDAAWASLAMYSPNGARVDLDQFLQAFLGPRSDPTTQVAFASPRARSFAELFASLDHDRKGYLTRVDIVAWQTRLFKQSDRNHDQTVTQDETTVR